MSGHTQGPWRFDLASDERITAERVCVALVTRGVDPECDEHFGGPVFEANARLIAAAPDLLAALHRAAEALDAYSDVNDGQDGPTPNTAMSALQEIDEVIAKAEGKPR